MRGTMIRTRFIAIMLVCCLYGLVAEAQQDSSSPYPKVTIASPTAASLGKYTDVPVSYHTGVPQISVPIYTVKEGPLTLPISLSYHAGGVKVMEAASWVGMGWSLQAGGMISRVVRGAPDEAGTTAVGQYGHFSHYGYNSYITQTQGGLPYDAGFASGVYDGEPDLFTFNFNGHSGKFYFDDDRKPVLVDGDDLKIEYYFPRDTAASYTAQSANIQGFILTDAQGTRYHFGITPGGNGAGAAAVEMTYSFSGVPGVTDRVYASWFLNKIESADRLFSITLNYEKENYSYYTLSMFPVDPSAIPQWPSGPQPEYRLAKNYIEGVRLNLISFSNGSVAFTPGPLRTDLSNSLYSNIGYTDFPNTEARGLESISITNTQGFCKKFRLYQSYFNAQSEGLPGFLSNYSVTSDQQRLRLDSLQEMSCDGGIQLAPYKFGYQTGVLSRRLSFGQDHWGYANGITTNTTLVPTYTINTFEVKPGANREPSWPAMQQGILTKITYPTGGFTFYEYEPHRTWINTTRYSDVSRFLFSVGYDGSNTATYSNVTFSGNYYRVIRSNGLCPPNTSVCAAGASLVNGSGSINLGGIDGNKTDTTVIQIPSGTYTLNMSRQATQTGTGAQYRFIEIVPQHVQENAIVGGLRIKQITQKENLATADSMKTFYDYNTNGRSSGVLYSRPVYVQVVRNEVVKKFGLSPAYGNETTHPYINGCLGPEIAGNNFKYFKSSAPIFPMATTQGNHIGYNEVRVYQNGNGYSIYRYYGSDRWDLNTDDISYKNVNPSVCSPALATSPGPPLPYEYRRGDLKQVSHFNQSGQLLKEVWHTMQYDSTQATPAYMVNNVLGFQLGTIYELRGYRKTQSTTTTTTYVPSIGASSQLVQTTYNESPWHNQPTRRETVFSVGDTQTVRTQYAADFRISQCDTISSGVTAYNTACNSCDLTLANANNTCTTVTCRYWAWINNLLCRANARKGYIDRRRLAFTNPVNAFSTCLQNAKNAAFGPLKPILQLQQQASIVPIEQATWRNGGLLSSSFLVYDYMANPVTSPYLAKARQIRLSTPAATFTAANAAPGNTTLTMDARYEDDAVFKYGGGNPIQIMLNDGVSNVYLWDYQNTLPIAKVVNAVVDQVAYTSFETDSCGGWVLNTGANKVAGGFTGKKSLTGGVNKSVAPGNYVVSVWCIGNVWVNGQLQTQAPVKMLDSWKCFEAKVNNVSAINVTGDLIDEVRLHPQGAQMITYCYLPQVGITSQIDPGNQILWYEYDALGRLVRIRNENRQIVKQIDYQYQAPTHSNSIWQSSGIVRCKPCASNPAFETGMLQNQEKDVNPNSSSFDSARWVDAGIHSSCDAVTYWQNTATPVRCRQGTSGNTGEREQEQKDMNPCSPSYNSTRWTIVDTNTTACPLPPPPCNSTTCGANNQKCINGVCETGVEVVVSSVYKKVAYQGGPYVWKWECTRKYCFTDGTSSTYNWFTWHDSPCTVGGCSVE